MSKRFLAVWAAFAAVVATFIVSTCLVVGSAYAVTSSVSTAAVTPSYANPVTGSIEDAAGTSNVALAESMVQGVTYPNALVEVDTAGNTFVTLRFKMADQVSQMQFWADNGDGNFAEASAQQMQTGTSSDGLATADYRFQVPSVNSHIRVSMFVGPMGRAVVYFVSVANPAAGNTDPIPFKQTITPGEEAAAPAPTPAPADNAASGDTSASAAGSSEAAPSTEGGENTGVQEYNAEGQEVTDQSNEQKPLDGSTTTVVVVVIVAVVVVAGVIAYFAYFKPKRAKQAAAAAAAAAAAKPAGSKPNDGSKE